MQTIKRCAYAKESYDPNSAHDLYDEKKAGLDNEASALLSEIRTFLGIDSVDRVRVINRYDAENISEELFSYAVNTVFSEPQLDDVYYSVGNDGASVFATEYLLI